MKSEDLNQLIDGIKETIGETEYAKVADSFATLVAQNTETLKTMQNKDDEITKLQDTNDKLVKANGALFMQVSAGKKEEPKAPESKPEYFDYHSAFDENGNII